MDRGESMPRGVCLGVRPVGAASSHNARRAELAPQPQQRVPGQGSAPCSKSTFGYRAPHGAAGGTCSAGEALNFVEDNKRTLVVMDIGLTAPLA